MFKVHSCGQLGTEPLVPHSLVSGSHSSTFSPSQLIVLNLEGSSYPWVFGGSRGRENKPQVWFVQLKFFAPFYSPKAWTPLLLQLGPLVPLPNSFSACFRFCDYTFWRPIWGGPYDAEGTPLEQRPWNSRFLHYRRHWWADGHCKMQNWIVTHPSALPWKTLVLEPGKLEWKIKR